MYATLAKLFGFNVAPIDLPKPFAARSPRWAGVEKAHKVLEATCQVCGGKHDLEVHHKMPYHLDASKELDPSNLITLCRHDHFTWGHNGTSWSDYNPNVDADAAACRQMLGKARKATKIR